MKPTADQRVVLDEDFGDFESINVESTVKAKESATAAEEDFGDFEASNAGGATKMSNDAGNNDELPEAAGTADLQPVNRFVAIR